mmetsp:Transcript_31/g.42  ORF Transcript_31/g.42 Transcript_31/m.42 type:complete len:82 (-) Transcript_31:1274-1519(-)
MMTMRDPQRSARAITRSCLCPTEKFDPPSDTSSSTDLTPLDLKAELLDEILACDDIRYCNFRSKHLEADFTDINSINVYRT